jgi:hypothetical protein
MHQLKGLIYLQQLCDVARLITLEIIPTSDDTVCQPYRGGSTLGQGLLPPNYISYWFEGKQS